MDCGHEKLYGQQSSRHYGMWADSVIMHKFSSNPITRVNVFKIKKQNIICHHHQ